MEISDRLTPLILARSPEWLVVSKPAGMLTIPASTPTNKTAPGDPGETDLLAWARKQEGPVWITHRLDRETSGVVLLARTEQDHRRASLWFQERKIKKQYHCLASGIPQAPFFKVNQAVRGVPSMTQIEVLERYSYNDCSIFLAKAFPRTGRRHQIRIHLSQSGHPILGDTLYGGTRELQLGAFTGSVNRVALHASQLELPNGERFESPFPEDFSAWLTLLRTGGRGA